MKKIIVLALVVMFSATASAADSKRTPSEKQIPPFKQEFFSKLPNLPKKLTEYKVVIDPAVLKALQGEACPQGKTRFFAGDGVNSWDVVGFCGVLNDPHCLPHYIYVDQPSGSVNEHSIGGMVWIVLDYPGSASIDGKEITGGYVCVQDKNDPVFTNPPPKNACPSGSHEGGHQAQYWCWADIGGVTIQDECITNYSKVYHGWAGQFPDGTTQDGFSCALGKFDYLGNNFTECGPFGARAVGGGGGFYCCAYTK